MWSRVKHRLTEQYNRFLQAKAIKRVIRMLKTDVNKGNETVVRDEASRMKERIARKWFWWMGAEDNNMPKESWQFICLPAPAKLPTSVDVSMYESMHGAEWRGEAWKTTLDAGCRVQEAGGRRGRLNSLDHCSSDGPAGARQGPQRTDHPLVESGGHTREEPSGERKHEENESEKEGGARRGGSERHGEIPLRGNCPRRASATKGIKEMRALDGKQANNHWDLFLPPFRH
ncbi:hypothetical protein INR49_016960 [Caranx melampygus]|nr:hypothetical protein INR49_016960 [Caranx melampygus]